MRDRRAFRVHSRHAAARTSRWLVAVLIACGPLAATGIVAGAAASSGTDRSTTSTSASPATQGNERARPATKLTIKARSAGTSSTSGSTATLATTTTPTPPFTECPAVGNDTSCGELIQITDGGANVYIDSSQPPYDGVEDTLVGVLNSSSQTVSSLQLASNTDLFGFDGDGLCSGVNSGGILPFSPPPAGCPFGATGYEGPNNTFSSIASDYSSGEVDFTTPLAPGDTAYFSLEEEAPTITVGPPFIMTQAVPTGGPNDAVYDTATLSGGPASYGGSLTFKVYATFGDCSADLSGTVVGNSKTVNGDGSYQSDDLPTPIALGSYFWRVFYSGDPSVNLPPETSTCDAQTEQSVISGPACGDAALIGVRGSGDNSYGDDYAGRQAYSLANYLMANGVRLYNGESGEHDNVIGVIYPAVNILSPELVGYGVSVSTGAKNLLTEISTLRGICGASFPILLTGFSQGAHVIQSVLEQLDDRANNSGDQTWRSIAGVALFASPRFNPTDPDARGTFPQSWPRFGLAGESKIRARFSGITRTYCIASDPVCQAPLQALRCFASLNLGTALCLTEVIGSTYPIHTHGYDPCTQSSLGNPPTEDTVFSTGGCTADPLLRDAAALLRWAVRQREGLSTPPSPSGQLQAYRDINPINTIVSAGAVYANGSPTTRYDWDFDSNGTIDYTSSSPFVIHAYGVHVGPFGSKTETTTVHIHHDDGSETVRSICINRAITGSVTC